MPILQKVSVPDVDVAGNRMPYHTYQTVIPAGIIRDAAINCEKPLYARISQNHKSIVLSRESAAETRRITLRSKRTRHYKGMPCYVTKIIIPKQFVQMMNLKKGDKLDFTTHKTDIIISK